MAVDVLDHHDGVVDQNADGEDQREQRHAVQREAPGPAGKQRGRQRQDDGSADDDRFAPAKRQAHQQDYRRRGEGQLLDQLVGLVGCGGAVVAHHGGLDAGRDQRVVQRVQPLACGAGHVHRVLAGLLGDGQRDGRVACAIMGRRTGALSRRKPHLARGLRRAVLHLRHFAQIHRLALVHAHHQVGHVLRRAQELAGFHGQHARRGAGLIVHHVARGQCHAGRAQRLLQAHQVHAAFAQALRVQRHLHHAAGAADGGHLAHAGHALQFGLDRVRHAFQFAGRRVVAAPQRHRQHRHVVDALGLDDRRQHAQPRWKPVLIGVEHVVQPHQRLGARHAHLELHRQQRHAGARHRIGMLDAGDLAQHLLGRPCHQRLHVGTAGAREGDQHVGHRDVDLRLFLARRHQHRKQAQQQRHQRQQRRQGVGLEGGGQAARHAQGGGGCVHAGGLVQRAAGVAPARPARTGSVAMRSPAFRPASTGTWLPCAAPRRTAFSTKRLAPAAVSTA